MDNLFYCLDCRLLSASSGLCPHCNSEKLKELTRKAPVNVIGSKLKGRVLKIQMDSVNVLFVDENKNKYIKEFEFSKLRKVL
ncbi:MAG: hypothetical protein N2645_23385 [Clostridia bacterium]|nr:hypothetical protein [Clostridia bacterium]